MIRRIDDDYHAARNEAQRAANEMQRPVGITRQKEYGTDGYNLSYLPVDPSKRFGWEIRCEVVCPSTGESEKATIRQRETT